MAKFSLFSWTLRQAISHRIVLQRSSAEKAEGRAHQRPCNCGAAERPDKFPHRMASRTYFEKKYHLFWIENCAFRHTQATQSLMAGVVPGISNYPIDHITLYKVHQRVAKTFRQHRAFLVGDAAHINNPLGGMGMNSGIHDAVNLVGRLAAVWSGKAPDAELDRFDKKRRLVTLEYIQNYTIQNKKNLESSDDEFRQSLQAISADPIRTREFLLRVSMIASLRRAEELG
jgi:hypothetical protein